MLERVSKAAVEVEFAENADHFRVIKSETPDPDDEQQENSGDGDLETNSNENRITTTATVTKKEETTEEQRNVISLLSDDEEDNDDDEEQRNIEKDNDRQTVEEQEMNNNSRKRAVDTEDSIQTTQSESSVEKSPGTPGNTIVNNKRPRTNGEQGEEPFQSRFAPIDPNDLLSLVQFAPSAHNNNSNNFNNNFSDLL